VDVGGRPCPPSLQEELDRCPFHDLLQMVAVTADDQLTVIRLPFRPELGLAWNRQAFHGGVLASLVDITAHATLALRTGGSTPTIDLRVDYLKPAGPPFVVAEGRVLKLGGTVGRADVEIKNAAGDVVACGRGTFSTMRRDGSSAR
jgi:uncharacterized protein (TIGR00369 family)